MSDQRVTNTTPNNEQRYPPGYGAVEPVANYRPWDVDDAFQGVYEVAKQYTMVDEYRLWILWTLVRQLHAPRGAVLEVGSWRGGSSATIASAIVRSPVPTRRLLIADTFAGVVKASDRDSYYRGGEHANASPEDVRSVFTKLGLSAPEILPGVFPEETAAALAGEEFSFAHIDVDVYAGARDVFEWIWPRMISGGVVVFDDYGFYGCEGVTSFVQELMADGRAVVVPNLSGQAIVIHS